MVMRLSIESELARKIDFNKVIKAFAHQKARKACHAKIGPG